MSNLELPQVAAATEPLVEIANDPAFAAVGNETNSDGCWVTAETVAPHDTTTMAKHLRSI